MKALNPPTQMLEENECWELLRDLQLDPKPSPIHNDFIQESDPTCEKCNYKQLVILEGQHVCPNCSKIQSRVIDDGAEWRFYGSEDNRGEDPTRCGMPTNHLLPKSSLGSMIGFKARGRRYLLSLKNPPPNQPFPSAHRYHHQ